MTRSPHVCSTLLVALLPLAAQTPSPVPSAEAPITGSIDLGYRWRTDVGGSADTYRSTVNLRSGPKLFGTEFSITKTRFFYRIHVRANSWGDEPYATFHRDPAQANRSDFSLTYPYLTSFTLL